MRIEPYGFWRSRNLAPELRGVGEECFGCTPESRGCADCFHTGLEDGGDERILYEKQAAEDRERLRRYQLDQLVREMPPEVRS